MKFWKQLLHPWTELQLLVGGLKSNLNSCDWADFTQQIFLTWQRPLTSNILFLYSNWWPEFDHLSLNSWIKVLMPLNAHLMSKGTSISINYLYVWMKDRPGRRPWGYQAPARGRGGDFIKRKTKPRAGMMGRSDDPLLLPSLAEVLFVIIPWVFFF